MVRTPEGKCYWPSFPIAQLLEVASIRQLQLRQVSLDSIEVSVVMEGQLTAEHEILLQQRLHASLNYPFHLRFICVDTIEVQKNGKFEDFISLL
jgi:hypothetical protein